MLSVIVCTRNRAPRLEQTLKSLQEMAVPVDVPWELIIVDNNSSDNTKEVINGFIDKSSLNVKCVIERRQGLSHARNTGVQASSGNILAFTDDDCIVDRYWVTSISKGFQSDKSIAGVGGRVELYDQMDRRVSIRVYKERMILDSVNRIFNLIIGCNMAFAREVFDKVGMFDPDFGAGARFASAEDSDFLYRAYKEGLKIIYSPDVLVYHNHGRKDGEQVNSLYKGYATGHGAFYCKYILKADKDVLRLACSEILSLTRQITKRLFKRQSPGYQSLFLRFIMIGFMYKLIKIRSSVDRAPLQSREHRRHNGL
jgi:glycosyltransferase involved in cell wall biosynthesis